MSCPFLGGLRKGQVTYLGIVDFEVTIGGQTVLELVFAIFRPGEQFVIKGSINFHCGLDRT